MNGSRLRCWTFHYAGNSRQPVSNLGRGIGLMLKTAPTNSGLRATRKTAKRHILDVQFGVGRQRRAIVLLRFLWAEF